MKEVPAVKLLDWRVYEVQQADRSDRTRHFVGSVGRDVDGQCSSAILTFDPATGSGVSERGRVYQLVGGGSGIGMNASDVWNSWKRKSGAADVIDVTPEVEKLLSNYRLEVLKSAVQVGIAGSEAGRYTNIASSEALAAHLRSLL